MGKNAKKRAREAFASSTSSTSSIWNKFKWNPVGDEANEGGEGGDDGDMEDAMFFGIEELDSRSYKIEKSGNGGLKVLSRSIEQSEEKDNKKRKKTSAKTEGVAKEKSTEVGADDTSDEDSSAHAKGKKQKQKKEKKQNGEKKKGKEDKPSSQESNLTKYTSVPPVSYSSWCNVKLHSTLTESLTGLGFETPTSIQSSSIPVINERISDVVGAAETGSGKTLAFSVPIVNSLLVDWVSITTARIRDGILCPYAMIIVPTRELAMQISAVIKEVSLTFRSTYRVEIVSIVGGMSEQKQRRQLDGKSPVHIIVATPGRLCELMEDETLTVFRDMAHLRYLVVDEADRIVEEGHFAEVHRIFSRIKDHEQLALEGKGISESSRDGEERKEGNIVDYGMDIDEERIGQLDYEVPTSALPELPSEEEIERARRDQTDQPYDEIAHEDDDQYRDQEGTGDGNTYRESPRQTLLFSATALRIQGLKQIHNEGRKGGKKTKKKLAPLPGLTQEVSEQLPEHVHQLMRLVGQRSRVDIIDVTSDKALRTVSVSTTSTGERMENKGKVGDDDDDADADADAAADDDDGEVSAMLARNLPRQLVHRQINTPAEDKDVYAYYYLQANQAKRVLVFVNSIKTSRRLDGLLRALNMNCRVIHAQLQQKQRLKALESFQKTPSGILVATDVAARGLDIPNVDTVLHYDIARSSQVYIHRSGRTARANKAGISISLVAPEDHLHHSSIVDIIGTAKTSASAGAKLTKADKLRAKLGGLEEYSVDSVAVNSLRQRCILAKKIFLHSFLQGQEQKDSTWLKQTSAAAGIDVDEDLASELTGADNRVQGRGASQKGKGGGKFDTKKMTKKELERLRWELRQLLATPISSSTNSGIGARKKGFFVVSGDI